MEKKCIIKNIEGSHYYEGSPFDGLLTLQDDDIVQDVRDVKLLVDSRAAELLNPTVMASFSQMLNKETPSTPNFSDEQLMSCVKPRSLQEPQELLEYVDQIDVTTKKGKSLTEEINSLHEDYKSMDKDNESKK